MVSVARLQSNRKLIFLWRLYLLRLATSVPLTDTARWTHEWTTGESSDKLVTENKRW